MAPDEREGLGDQDALVGGALDDQRRAGAHGAREIVVLASASSSQAASFWVNRSKALAADGKRRRLVGREFEAGDQIELVADVLGRPMRQVEIGLGVAVGRAVDTSVGLLMAKQTAPAPSEAE